MERSNLYFNIMAFCVAVTAMSCQDQSLQERTGDEIRFMISSNGTSTKASYSGEGTASLERIDWNVGDLLRVYCAEASTPDSKQADYQVTVESPSTQHPEISIAATAGTGEGKLSWGTGSHIFYAAYPSPAAYGVTTGISTNIVTASLPAEQPYSSILGSNVNYVAEPDMKNMLMTAKSAPYNPESMGSENVSLSFTPLTTAIKFTITNQTKAALTVKSVALTSASSAMNGAFKVDIDDTSHQPSSIDLGNTTVTYEHTYPYCQMDGSITDARKIVFINFPEPVSLAYDEDPSKCGSLSFTFFLLPTQNFNDMTFKIVTDDKWLSTKLGYTDGSGILFPQFKKTEIDGLLIPEGAKWMIKYQPTVEQWNNGGSTPIRPVPGVEYETFVTSWDSGVEDDIDMRTTQAGTNVRNRYEGYPVRLVHR